MKTTIFFICILIFSCTKFEPDNRLIANGRTVYVNWHYWKSMPNVDIQGAWIVDSLSNESQHRYAENFYFIHNAQGNHELFEDRALQFTPSHETFLDKIVH